MIAEEKHELSVKLVDKLFLDAFTDKASNIHLEPLKDGVMIKYRINGVLQNIKFLSIELAQEVIYRLKEMAALNIDTIDKTQQGRIMVKHGNEEFDLDIGIMPAIYGEKVSMKIMSADRGESARKGFENIGFKNDDLSKVKEIFSRAFGLIIVTGSSGSGKTTTCHCALNYIQERSQGKVNIMSLEDCFIYPMEGITQIIVRPDMEGQDYYSLLKGVMWQDPDVIFVGEAKNSDVLYMISELVLTGHLVILQMDSPDICHAIENLNKFGLESYLLASIIEGAISQRLVRKICENCKEEFIPSGEIIDKYFKEFVGREIKLYRGKGCKECHYSGYKGRSGIYELMTIDNDMKEKISRGENINNDYIINKGCKTLKKKALECVLDGMTTLEEAIRVTW